MDARTLLSDSASREWIANLWNRHQRFLLDLAYFHLRDWDRAEDVVQQMWVGFIQTLPRFERRCSERTWLVRILKRCIQKEQRGTVSTRTREVLFGILRRGPDEPYSETMESAENWHKSPEQLLLAQECLEEIWRAGRALPQRQAEVWYLRDVVGQTAEDVSAALGLTLENERVLRHRAHQRLKAELRRYLGKTKASQPAANKAHDLQRS